MTDIPEKEGLNTRAFSQLFRDTHTSYKYLLFLSILDQARAGERKLSAGQIASGMLDIARAMVRGHRLFMGKDDRSDMFLKRQDECGGDAPSSVVREILEYAPYNLLAPFFREKTRRLSGKDLHKTIYDLAKDGFETGDSPPIYRLRRESMHVSELELHPRWMIYLDQNRAFLRLWAKKSFAKFLTQQNRDRQDILDLLLTADDRRLQAAEAEIQRIDATESVRDGAFRPPEMDGLNVSAMSELFRNTNTSYKYLLFLSILDLAEEGGERLPARKVVSGMLNVARPVVRRHRLLMGKDDSSDKFLDQQGACGSEAPPGVVQKILEYVPYNLLAPFYKKKVKNLAGKDLHQRIRDLAEDDFAGDSPPLYRLRGEDMQVEELELHPEWTRYLGENKDALRAWATESFAEFLERNNRGQPDILERLLDDGQRRRIKGAIPGKAEREAVHAGGFCFPAREGLDIRALSKLFAHVYTSHKYLLFLSILNLTKDGEERLPASKIAAGMLDVVRPIVRSRFDMGRDDNSAEFINRQDEYGDKVPPDVVKKLMGYAPYNLLTPFYKKESRHQAGTKLHNDIYRLAENSFSSGENPPIYRFRHQGARVVELELHPRWMSYFAENRDSLRLWALENFAKFLGRSNKRSNIMSFLMEEEESRQIIVQRDFWRHVVLRGKTACIYTGAALTADGFELSHYVPYRFVGHHKIWNLLPTLPEVKAAKSDSIPHSRYLGRLAAVHGGALDMCRERSQIWGESGAASEYASALELGGDLTCSEAKLHAAYERLVNPLVEKARQCGFPDEWQY